MLEGEGASYEPSRRSIHWLKVCSFLSLLFPFSLLQVADNSKMFDATSSRRTTSLASETQCAPPPPLLPPSLPSHLLQLTSPSTVRPRRRRGRFREGQAHERLRRLPPRVLGPRGGGIPAHLQDRHWILRGGSQKPLRLLAPPRACGEEASEFFFPFGGRSSIVQNAHTNESKYYNVGTSKGPDVYFEPKMVWEVLAADLSLSPIYPAARRQVRPLPFSRRLLATEADQLSRWIV